MTAYELNIAAKWQDHFFSHFFTFAHCMCEYAHWLISPAACAWQTPTNWCRPSGNAGTMHIESAVQVVCFLLDHCAMLRHAYLVGKFSLATPKPGFGPTSAGTAYHSRHLHMCAAPSLGPAALSTDVSTVYSVGVAVVTNLAFHEFST